MKKLIYPGIFHKEDNAYWVEFPDLTGCQSFGDTLDEVYENAREALAAYCVTLLEQNRVLNTPSDVFSINPPADAFVSLVDADLIKKSQAVKKTLTIPSWLNALAEERHINFSGTLQDALIRQLGIAQ
jgi:predicted RNase H-like HicB family nuclease